MKLAKTDHLDYLIISKINSMFRLRIALLKFAKAIVKIELALLDERRCPFPSRRVEPTHPLLRFLQQLASSALSKA
jgi:hypothetical protein